MFSTYGMRLGVKLLARGRVKRGLRYLAVPVNYWRGVEYRLVYEAGEFTAGDRVLDVGSPKLLALYLAKHVGAEVHATDIEPYFIEEYRFLSKIEGIPPLRFHPQVEDGRHLSFAAESFTRVYAISVVEHIPDDGDSACLREIARVLAPGGRCLLTVPFSPVSKVEYKHARDFYWSGASAPREGTASFYQRRYSEEDLHIRLIEPSGLRLRQLRYVGERVLTHSPHEFCEYLPLYLGPVHPLASLLVHTRPSTSWRALKKPLCALVVLEKPADSVLLP
ncbi:MAG: class I SAM-dependent methyltransferase [Ktedonobacterales bacterium]|nr:class I SAM-dependent methyltransferase [Ktedonobacterales bacterium]